MVALGVSNLCFMLPWQFAQFVLLTQVNAEQEKHRDREIREKRERTENCDKEGARSAETKGRDGVKEKGSFILIYILIL